MRVVHAMDMVAEPHVSGEAPSRFRPFPRSNVLSALREPNPSIPCHFDDRRSPCGAKRVTHSKLMQVSVGSARFSTYTGMHQSMSICMLSVQSASIVSPRSLVWLVMRRCVSFFARTKPYSKKIAGTQKDIWDPCSSQRPPAGPCHVWPVLCTSHQFTPMCRHEDKRRPYAHACIHTCIRTCAETKTHTHTHTHKHTLTYTH